MDFKHKLYFYLSTFLIQVLLITYGCCNTEDNSKIRNFLNTLKNDRNLKSFQFFPVKIHMLSNKRKGDVNLYDVFNKALRSSKNMNFEKDKVVTSKAGKRLRYLHRKRMEELIDFMRDRYSSTNYFYSEMQRIKSQYTIKDQMREMIDYCESPEHEHDKQKILKLYTMLKKKSEKQKIMWDPPTNKLVINILKDPFNDGVAK